MCVCVCVCFVHAQTMVQNVDEGLIDKVVLPQLVKLARDTEM